MFSMPVCAFISTHAAVFLYCLHCVGGSASWQLCKATFRYDGICITCHCIIRNFSIVSGVRGWVGNSVGGAGGGGVIVSGGLLVSGVSGVYGGTGRKTEGVQWATCTATIKGARVGTNCRSTCVNGCMSTSTLAGG